MVRIFVWTCAALLFAASASRAADVCEATQRTAAGAPSHQKDGKRADQPAQGREGRKKWWVDGELRGELGITDQQSAAMEAVWQKSFAQRAELGDRLEKLDAVLQKMILEAADEAAVIAQLDRVEAARSDANKARVLMLYRMNRLLTQEQRMKLDAKVKAMRERDGRRGGGPR